MAAHSLIEFRGASIKSSGKEAYYDMGKAAQKAFSIYKRGIVDQQSSYPSPSSKQITDGDKEEEEACPLVMLSEKGDDNTSFKNVLIQDIIQNHHGNQNSATIEQEQMKDKLSDPVISIDHMDAFSINDLSKSLAD